MSTEQFANNAQTQLVSAIDASVTSLTVQSASGFPSSAQFRILIDQEILLVTGMSGTGNTTWAVQRAMEGPGLAAPHGVGAQVTQVLTAGGLENLDASYIGTGTVALARGGTGSDLSATGGNGQYLKQSSGGANVSVGTIAAGDLPVMVASGASHAPGSVPDPGGTAGTTRYLREDASWQAPPGSGAQSKGAFAGGRLTTVSGTAVTTTDQTAVQTIYYTPYLHAQIDLYNGSWSTYSFSEQSLKLTDSAETGNTTNASAVVTNLTSTAQLVRGMQVTGTGIPANTTIASINSSSQITLSANATATGSGVALTFKLPPNKNYDVFGIVSGGNLAIQLGNAWTNDTTRADALGTQDGVQVNNAAINSGDSNSIAGKQGRFLGTIRTTGTAGQTEDSGAGATSGNSTWGRRFVWNMYNRCPRWFKGVDTTASWTYSSSTFRAANGSSNNRAEIVLGLADTLVEASVDTLGSAGSNLTACNGIGIDSTTSNSAQIYGFNVYSGALYAGGARYKGLPGIGYHQVYWLESSSSSMTWYGNPSSANQGGLMGTAVA